MAICLGWWCPLLSAVAGLLVLWALSEHQLGGNLHGEPPCPLEKRAGCGCGCLAVCAVRAFRVECCLEIKERAAVGFSLGWEISEFLTSDSCPILKGPVLWSVEHLDTCAVDQRLASSALPMLHCVLTGPPRGLVLQSQVIQPGEKGQQRNHCKTTFTWAGLHLSDVPLSTYSPPPKQILKK